jgi:hypothetical protein
MKTQLIKFQEAVRESVIAHQDPKPATIFDETYFKDVKK